LIRKKILIPKSRSMNDLKMLLNFKNISNISVIKACWLFLAEILFTWKK